MITEAMPDPADERLPRHTVLGPYRLVEPLGEGGMGVVHLALDRHGKAVAVKVLRSSIAHDPVARARLAREVETLRRVSDERVASIIDADIDGDRPYVVTRFVPGPPLDEVVERSGPARGQALVDLASGVAEALTIIHAAGVVHRDIKPANVLLVDGRPVLIDFGIAHVTHDVRLTMTGLVMGTPGYLSPEVVDGGDVTPATDWWGWAATVAYAASGHPPFGRGPMEAVLTRVARGEPDLSGVDPRLAGLLAAALHPTPAARPTVPEVLGGLRAYAAGRDATEAFAAGRPVPRTRALTLVTTPAAQPVGPAVRPAIAPVVGVAALSGVPRTPGLRELEERGPRPLIDPRIGKPPRTGLFAALAALVVAGVAVAPALTSVVVLVGLIAARTADRSVTSLLVRRNAAGIRRRDVPLAVATSPWHLLLSVGVTLLWAVMPFAVAVSSAFSATLLVSGIRGRGVPVGSAVPLAAGALLGLLMMWWGPGGAPARRGARSLVRGLTRTDLARDIVLAVVLVATGALVLVAWQRGGIPTWLPLSHAPGLADWTTSSLP